jgi:cell division protein FtsW (lipid II flippase)
MPVVVGILYMAACGAPQIYIVSNSGAGIAILAGILFLPKMKSLQAPIRAPFIVSGVILALIAATFAGPGVDGVQRWIKLGPFNLHAGMLLLPVLVVILPELMPRLGCVATLLATTLFALQPDFASAFALCAASLVVFALTRNCWSLVAFLGACVALALTLLQFNILAPVSFVEAVVQDAAAVHPIISIGMILSVIMAVVAPIVALSKNEFAKQVRVLAWSACLIGYFLASLIGAYPTPLLGFGVSSILGFGCACILLIQAEDVGNLRSPLS